MRYESSDDIAEFKSQIGLAPDNRSKSQKFSEFIRWYFTIDMKDWSNYVAVVIAVFLFWYGIKTILAALAFS